MKSPGHEHLYQSRGASIDPIGILRGFAMGFYMARKIKSKSTIAKCDVL